MDKISNAANYVADTVKGAANTASKEANKEVAKDNNADLSTRWVVSRDYRIVLYSLLPVTNRHDSASAAKDAIGDKVDEKRYETSADVNKEAAKH